MQRGRLLCHPCGREGEVASLQRWVGGWEHAERQEDSRRLPGVQVRAGLGSQTDVPQQSLWERVTGRFGDGWADESTQRGKRRTHAICRAYSSSLLPPIGIAFTTTTSLPGQYDPGSALSSSLPSLLSLPSLPSLYPNTALPSSLPSALPSPQQPPSQGNMTLWHCIHYNNPLPGQYDPGSAARGGAGGNGAREGERLSPETHTARQSGIAFTTTTPSQGNMTLVVQRGVVLEGGGGNRQAELEGRLKEAAAAVEEEGAVPFTVAPRVVRGLKVLPVEWQAELEGRLKEAAAAVEEGGAVPFTVAPRVVRGLKVFPVEWWCC
ncbi:unnamed protein product [Closterium sp. Naga37s-1]|nr:unnamed protein product [Closterium sp. Naga37s-1]